MRTTLKHKNRHALRFMTAVLFGLAAAAVLMLVPLYPAWLAVSLAAGAGLLFLTSPSLAALALAIAGSLPVMATDLVTGLAVLIIALIATQYLANGRAGGFLLLTLAAVLVPVRAEWALAALAGYLLGIRRGALAAAVICLAIELAGLLTGAPAIGAVVTGGTGTGLIDPAVVPQITLSFAWLSDAIAAADPDRLLSVLRGAENLGVLGIQPLLWAGAAAVAGGLKQGGSRTHSLLGVVASILALAASTLLLGVVLQTPAGAIVPTAAISLILALCVTVVAEWVFPAEPIAQTVEVESSTRSGSTRSEDADVDDLLRVIASAEDELTARHRTQAVVLITDMKSFSAMTEDLGSLESAKVVQRHRDLLLPVIERHGGKGKSTGGDGLVAAFSTPGEAVQAAVRMQRAIQEFCRTDTSCGDLRVRIGVADGEVVLDKGGRPFLGSALNLAARIMDLADGGRVMLSGSVAAALPIAGEYSLHSHGEFKLKNIAEPLPVFEALWDEGMEAQEIRAT